MRHPAAVSPPVPSGGADFEPTDAGALLCLEMKDSMLKCWLRNAGTNLATPVRGPSRYRAQFGQNGHITLRPALPPKYLTASSISAFRVWPLPPSKMHDETFLHRRRCFIFCFQLLHRIHYCCYWPSCWLERAFPKSTSHISAHITS